MIEAPSVLTSGAVLAPDGLSSATLTLDELDLLAHLLRIDELPVVLDASSQIDSTAERDAAFVRAESTLAERGLLSAGGPNEDLAVWLRLLARPDREIAVRRYSDTGSGTDAAVSRLCLAWSGACELLAVRGPNSLALRRSEARGPDLLQSAVGRAAPLEFRAVNAPTELLADAVDECVNRSTTARRFVELGATDADAGTLAAALAGCRAHAEIVAIRHSDAATTQVGGPVTVFDTCRGRIVGISSVSADGCDWSTLTPGTDARFRQALTHLISELG